MCQSCTWDGSSLVDGPAIITLRSQLTIYVDVENLSADINLNANVAQLVKINAGVQVGITKVNITIADVDAELDLIVRLGNLVEIVSRVFESLDLNPLLINTINGVTGLLDDIVGEVDGLLGSITQGGKTLSFVCSIVLGVAMNSLTVILDR